MSIELDYKAIGKRIKIERVKQDLTQEKLAEKANLSNAHISNVETGSTTVSLKTVIAISNALNVTPNDLLMDNFINAKLTFQNTIIKETEDCNELEIRIIADTVRHLKRSIRQRTTQLKTIENNY